MVQFNVFPGGLRRIVTFSYDDGPANDPRLVALFNKYGVKGTFHLNSRKYIGMTEDELDVIRDTYKGHEISCHTVHHGFLNRMPPASIVSEVIEDRKLLEHIAGYPVVGMSYPYGKYNDTTISALKSCGIVYSRTTQKESHAMELPRDFLEWHPTCHHKDVCQYIDSFLKNIDRVWSSIFYIWDTATNSTPRKSGQYLRRTEASIKSRGQESEEIQGRPRAARTIYGHNIPRGLS